MEEASENLDFEEAIRYRDPYNSVEAGAEAENHGQQREDKDIIALAKDDNDAGSPGVFVRDGRLIGRSILYDAYFGQHLGPDNSWTSSKQFYAGTPFVPRELMLRGELRIPEIVEQWLSNRRGSRVHIRVPKKGTKEKLRELTATNAALVPSKDRERIKREEGRTIGAVKEICALLSLPEISRMEAFDILISAALKTWVPWWFYEKESRSGAITGNQNPHSSPVRMITPCMKGEVLYRRFLHGMEEAKEPQEKQLEKESGSFTKFPDLLLMDGGKWAR